MPGDYDNSFLGWMFEYTMAASDTGHIPAIFL